MSLIPPNPVGVVPGSGLWNDWIEKIRSAVNQTLTGFSFALIQNTPTTLGGYGITDAQALSQKDQANGYAGLNGSSRTTKGVITTDKVVAGAFVLKSPNGHYWQAAIDNAGAVTWTDVGTTAP